MPPAGDPLDEKRVRKMMKRALTIFALAAAAAMAQSTVTGSKTMQGSWDASGASATKPAKSGATLPAACSTGEFFFNTAAAAGQNVYLCKPDNTWTQLAGGGSGGGGAVSSVFGRIGTVSGQSGDYTFSQIGGSVGAGQLPAAGGDLSGTLSSATVQALQGKSVAATAPASGQVLTWSGSAWAPQTPAAGSSATTASLVFDGSTAISGETMTAWSCTGLVSACSTNWTVPVGVNWVSVELWAGGGPGLGSTAGNGGAGGPGGGYARRICKVTPGASIAVQVGQGGTSSGGWGFGVTQGGDSSFGSCIGATAGVMTSIYSNGNVPGAMKINGVPAPAGPWVVNTGYWSNLAVDPTSATGTGTPGYNAVREDQGGWPGSGWLGGTGPGNNAGAAIGGGGGGGGGAAQNATPGAGGFSVLGGAGGVGGSSAAPCSNGAIPGGGGGGAYVAASGNTAGCNGARGEIHVYYVH